MIFNLVLYILAFVGIWVGAGMAIRSVERMSRSLRISSFAISFLILGFFTSISELSVGINSIVKNDPEIYVGNLIGASIVIFMLIIPLLAITGNGLRVNPEFQGFNLLLSIVVIATPVMTSMDGSVDRIDGLITLILYFALVFCIQLKHGILERVHHITQTQRHRFSKELLQIISGVIIIFLASRIVVNQTLYFSEVLDVSPFLISLLLISIGTNIPELSFVFRSLFMRSNQVAFGDYVGSAAFNSFLFGLLTLIYGKPVYLVSNYFVSLFFLILGLVIFYLIIKVEHKISRVEGFILLSVYMAFLFVELISR
jgi:cation:H+ antiporter